MSSDKKRSDEVFRVAAVLHVPIRHVRYGLRVIRSGNAGRSSLALAVLAELSGPYAGLRRKYADTLSGFRHTCAI